MGQIIYYQGGYIPTAKQFNEWQVWDDTTQTFTEYDTSGNVVTTRPYTAAEVAAYQAAQADAAAAAAVSTAATGLQGLITQQSAFATQLEADIATVTGTGWAALSASDQQAIMLRVLNGFGTLMQALADHLTVTGIS